MTVVPGVRAVVPLHVLPGQYLPEPVLLNSGQVAYQPEQRQVGRLDRAAGHPGCIKAGAFQFQGEAPVAEVPDQRGALAPELR